MYARVAYHTCGRELLVEERWNGHAYVEFYVDDLTDEEVETCPRCGERMLPRDFEPDLEDPNAYEKGLGL